MLGNSAQTIAPLVVGVVILIAATINEIYTTRSPIVPPRLFRVRPFPAALCASALALTHPSGTQVRTTAFILVSVFFHALAFFAGACAGFSLVPVAAKPCLSQAQPELEPGRISSTRIGALMLD